jgi:chitin synthase
MAVVQIVVLVGIMRQIADDGLCHPNTWMLIFMVGTFLIAGLMHPQEVFNLLHGVLYFLAIPTMYLLLIIYAICNLNVVSWGTRETTKTSSEKEKEQLIQNANDNIHQKAESDKSGLTKAMLNAAPEITNGIPIHCGSACRCLCCLSDTRSPEAQALVNLEEQLVVINNKLTSLVHGNQDAEDCSDNQGQCLRLIQLCECYLSL